MPRYALVIGGVVDTISLDGRPQGWVSVPDDVHAGFVRNANGSYSPPPAPSIRERRATMPPLSRRQFRLGMRRLGITASMIDAAILSIADKDAREVAQIEWEDAISFDRLHALVVMLSTAFSITPEALDAAWSEAAGY